MSIDLKIFKADLEERIEAAREANYTELRNHFVHLVAVASYLIGFIERALEDKEHD